MEGPLFLFGLQLAFAVATPGYVSYPDVMKVKKATFNPQFEETKYGNVIHRLDYKQCWMACTQLGEGCTWFAFDHAFSLKGEQSTRCTLLHKDVDNFKLDYSLTSTVGYVNGQTGKVFDVVRLKMDAGIHAFDDLHNKHGYDMTSCWKKCEDKWYCQAADVKFYGRRECSGKFCDDNYEDCYGYRHFFHMRYDADSKAIINPRITSTDSFVIVGFNNDVLQFGCEEIYFDGETSQSCERHCKKLEPAHVCPSWVLKGSYGGCWIYKCDKQTEIGYTQVNSAYISGIRPSAVLGGYNLKVPITWGGARLTGEFQEFRSQWRTHCYDACRTNPRCKAWSSHDDNKKRICRLAGGPYLELEAYGAFLHFMVKRISTNQGDDPCVFKGVAFSGTSIKKGKHYGTVLDCFTWCLRGVKCTLINYNTKTGLCELLDGKRSQQLQVKQFANENVLSALVRIRGSCVANGASFADSDTPDISTEVNVESAAACKKICEDWSKRHGDCYAYTWFLNWEECALHGLNTYKVHYVGGGVVSGRIKF